MLEGGGGGFWSCEAWQTVRFDSWQDATGDRVLGSWQCDHTVGARVCLIEYVRCIATVVSERSDIRSRCVGGTQRRLIDQILRKAEENVAILELGGADGRAIRGIKLSHGS